MSFSTEFKDEILNKKFLTNSERTAFVSAVLRVCGCLHIDSNGPNFRIETENYLLMQRVIDEFKILYDIEIEIVINSNSYIFEKSFTANLPTYATAQIASDTCYVEYVSDKPIAFAEGISIELTNVEEIKAYLLGIVVGGVSITVPQQSAEELDVYTGGYHLEMVFKDEMLAYDIMSAFAEFDIFLKKITKGDLYALYIKDSNMISDFMAFFGANMAVIELNNIIVARSLRGDVNRVNNCLIANIDKTVNAGQKQYIAIKSIERIIGLDKLAPKLKEIAEIRLNNPEYTLEQVAEIIGDGISKSGINHRFRKIIEIAKQVEEDYE